MSRIPHHEGRRPDVINFTFNGSVELDDDHDKITFATLGIGGEAIANCAIVSTGYGFKEKTDKDGVTALILTINLKVIDFSEDRSGMPLQSADDDVVALARESVSVSPEDEGLLDEGQSDALPEDDYEDEGALVGAIPGEDHA